MTIQKEILALIGEIFRKRKQGFCWLRAHFKSTDFSKMSLHELERVKHCLICKKFGFQCEVHDRKHDNAFLRKRLAL